MHSCKQSLCNSMKPLRLTAGRPIKITSKVWVYPGFAVWRFVNVDKETAAVIREKYGKSARGFGSLPVEVKLGLSVWKTSIFPDKQSGTYLLPLKSKIRVAEDIGDDDTIHFTIKILA